MEKPNGISISTPSLTLEQRERALETGRVETYACVRRDGRGGIVRTSIALEMYEDLQNRKRS
jgi:hypothetical protein